MPDPRCSDLVETLEKVIVLLVTAKLQLLRSHRVETVLQLHVLRRGLRRFDFLPHFEDLKVDLRMLQLLPGMIVTEELGDLLLISVR